MNTYLSRIFRIVVLAAALATSSRIFAQSSEGALVTVQDDRQKEEVTKLQERALARSYKVGQLQVPEGPVAVAKAATQKLLQTVRNGQMEDAARLYWEGVEAGVPRIMEDAAKALEEAAGQAATDAINVASWTGNSSTRPRPENVSADISGPAATQAAQILAEVEADRKTLQKDLDGYIAAVVKEYPELTAKLAQAGLTPSAVREIAKRSMSEADQLKYRAALYRISAVVWTSLPTIIKTRALSGGKAQALIHSSADETVQSSAGDKILVNK